MHVLCLHVCIYRTNLYLLSGQNLVHLDCGRSKHNKLYTFSDIDSLFCIWVHLGIFLYIKVLSFFNSF